jgi:RNA polymerase sigma-70 factor (ECF subfamily)
MLIPEFETLIMTHHPTVLRTARRLLGRIEDAEDAAQEVFLRLLRSHSEWRDVGPWLYRVTVNVCNDFYRRRKLLAELSPHKADTAPDPESTLRVRQTQYMVRRALGLLTRREQEAVVLRHIKEFSAAETALILNLNAATVRSRTHAARAKLAHHLRDLPPRGLSNEIAFRKSRISRLEGRSKTPRESATARVVEGPGLRKTVA